ncbi:MAG: isopentenyl-diphosphate Delta-isomerase [Rhodothermales bacterium]
MTDEVILVDELDREVGAAEKLAAHQSGQLHRALSVFVFNSAGDMLLQQRARDKYHSGGLLSNTCCSHPRPGEASEDAAHRRLMEEMGFDCPMRPLFTFTYRTDFGNGLIEHELDHVFVGIHDADPVPNPEEVEAWRWQSVEETARDMARRPEAYTFWFKHIFQRVIDALTP